MSESSTADRPSEHVETAIRFYEKGRLIHDDVLVHTERISALCLVKCSEMEVLETGVATTSSVEAPNRTARLRICCPGSLYDQCTHTMRDWHCERCAVPVEYGYDGLVYCECGRGPVNSLRFMCRDVVHGDEYVAFRSADLKNELQKLKRNEEINILLLGETGVGKSTFINAFVNYSTYERMEDARENLIALIPSSFTICKNDDFDECMVSIGDEGDVNEATGGGKSSTQSCKSYVFPYGDRVVRLIDTPGIGDTRGIEQDKKNFDNILRFLGHHTEVHGICILLKPNNARLTVMFRFCIMELLSHLHKSAKDNIAFVFTNPGDTMPPLREMLRKIRDAPPNVDIAVSKETIYCLDNEAFRFMATLKQGVEFGEKQKADFPESWTVSVSECKRLMRFVFSCTAHRVQDTVSVNEARRLILRLSKPLGDISRNIQMNLQVIAEKIKDVKFSTEHISDLKNQLYVPAIDLEYVLLDQPHTVCTSARCRDVVTTGGVAKYDYKTRCHKPCRLRDVEVNIVEIPELQNCYAMKGSGGLTCFHCGCSWRAHMHVMTESKHVTIQLRDDNIDTEIRTKEQGIKALMKNLEDLSTRSLKLQGEQKVIARTSARFCRFLKSNAIAAYNDSLLEYLGHLINEEKNLREVGANNAEVLNGLIRLKEAYEIEIKILTEADQAIDPTLASSSSPSSFSSAESIKAMVEELFALEINRRMIRQTMEEYNKALQAAVFAYSETVVRTRKRGRPSGKNFNFNLNFNDGRDVGRAHHQRRRLSAPLECHHTFTPYAKGHDRLFVQDNPSSQWQQPMLAGSRGWGWGHGHGLGTVYGGRGYGGQVGQSPLVTASRGEPWSAIMRRLRRFL